VSQKGTPLEKHFLGIGSFDVKTVAGFLKLSTSMTLNDFKSPK